MSEPDEPKRRATRRLPNTSAAESTIRSIAQVTSDVKLTTHARERMVERDISLEDALFVLRSGHVVDVSRHKGRIKCKVVRKLRGSGGREAGVVTIILDDKPKDGQLLVLTVEWEDR